MQKANKNDVRKEIADLITRIKEQSDRIGMQRDIPQSELDLILYRIEELHKKTVVWAYLNELPVESTPNIGAQFSVPGSETKAAPVEVPKKVEPVPVAETPKAVEPEKMVPPPAPVPAPEPVIVKQVEPVPQKEAAKGPVSSLKDVRTFIGINEKIMYIRQVFRGDDIAYGTAIEKINNIHSWAEAQTYLSVLAEQYKWGKHDEPSEIFTQTVKRRFS
jgi:hypothetical protein